MKTINIKFPLQDDQETNGLFGMNHISKDALTSNLVLLLLTEKGERYYLPDYGIDIKKYIFEPNDSYTHNDIEEEIKESVKKYIPQLTINRVTISQPESINEYTDNQINFIIDFTYSEDVFNERGRLELTI